MNTEPCPECGADPEDDHASWCLYEEEEDGVEAVFNGLRSAPDGGVGQEGVAADSGVQVGGEPAEHRSPDESD